MALDTNLISYWKLDESSGNASDSVGGNTLTNVGTATYSAGKINNGINLNGSSQYLDGGNVLNLTTGAWTFAAWIKVTTTGSYEFIGGRSESGFSNDWYMRVTNTNKAEIQFRNGASSNQVIGNITVADGNWHHVVGLRNGTNVLLYVDGILDASGTDNNYNCTNSFDFHIGADSAGALNFKFNGQIDEVAVWNRALSADEVLQIANSGRGNTYPFTATPSLYGAVAFYNLDESSGNASDSVGTYTLTNNNTATYTTGKINNCTTLGTGNTNKYFSATVVDPDSYNSGFSISFWLYFNTVPSGSDNDIFEFQDTSNSGIFMRVNSSTSTSFRFGTGNGADRGETSYTSSWAANTWYHIVMVHNATSNTYYVNGSQVAQKTTGTITLGGNNSLLNIGRNTANVNYSNARYDMFGVWAKALSGTEVQVLYQSGAGLQHPFAVTNVNTSNFFQFF